MNCLRCISASFSSISEYSRDWRVVRWLLALALLPINRHAVYANEIDLRARHADGPDRVLDGWRSEECVGAMIPHDPVGRIAPPQKPRIVMPVYIDSRLCMFIAAPSS
jgi:hypothetical protein